MATFRIHEDQENRLPEVTAPKGKQAIMAVQQKRTILGAISLDENVVLGVQNSNVFKKEPLQVKASLHLKENKDCLKENYGCGNKNSLKEIQVRKNIVNPIVPVAQFEAFKVYEDQNYEERLAKVDKKLKAKSTCQVYKGTADDRFVTKTEVEELSKKGLLPNVSNKNDTKKTADEENYESPMSVDRSCNLENLLNLREQEVAETDFFAVEEYSLEIYQYLKEHELLNRAKPGYMRKQPDITANMRTILVDWLVEVAEEYKLHTETLYLAVNFIDRFLSYMSVVRAKLQLVGTAAMFLASKYEEIYCPNIEEFVYITDDTYTKRQVIRMEHLILKVLNFELSVPTPLCFITSIGSVNKLSDKAKNLAMFLCELSMLEGERYLEFLPSALAASSIIIAQETLDEQVWGEKFIETTKYNMEQLRPCIEFLHDIFRGASTRPQHAVQDKYKAQKYLQVSLLTPKEWPCYLRNVDLEKKG